LSTYNAEFVTLAVWWTWLCGKCIFLLCEWLSVWFSTLDCYFGFASRDLTFNKSVFCVLT